MKCAGWEERIALAVEGDLPAREAAGVERHLAGCEGCREFEAALRKSQAVLKEFGNEAVDAAVLDRIRDRVMAQVAAQPRRKVWPWLWVPVPAFAALLAVVMLWPRNLPEIPPPPVPVASIPAAPPAPVIRWPRPAVVHVAARPKVPAAPPPLLMKIVTDDPNVVIYWIVEGKERGD